MRQVSTNRWRTQRFNASVIERFKSLPPKRQVIVGIAWGITSMKMPFDNEPLPDDSWVEPFLLAQVKAGNMQKLEEEIYEIEIELGTRQRI